MTRVDNRLIHGQVAESWLPAFKAQEVVLVCAQGADGAFIRKMWRLSLPAQYRLTVMQAAQAAQYTRLPSPLRQFVLVEDLNELKAMIEGGFAPPQVNIGNTRYEAGKKEISAGVYLTEREEDFVQGLKARGVKVDWRALPSSASLGRLF
jgi:mannose/fructose/N-acetylgalactosamine-specific phosphotransferase system component IIB